MFPWPLPIEPADVEACQGLLVRLCVHFQSTDRLNPVCERGKVGLFLAMRARLGHERVFLHQSALVASIEGEVLSPPRYVVRLDDFFVCEWGSGAWKDYPRLALRRARLVFKKRVVAVRVEDAPVKLSDIPPEQSDACVVRWLENQLQARLGC